jgi:uncharacterized RDD family membrane protein YckC
MRKVARRSRQESAMSIPTNTNYAPPRSHVEDPTLAGLPFELATRGSRLGATMLDGLMFAVPLFAILFFQLPRIGITRGQTQGLGTWMALARAGSAFYVVGLIELVLLVITLVFVHQNAQTIGKRICGIKVARQDGSQATLARIFFLRYLPGALINFLPALGYVYWLVDALFIFGERRRCIHDYIAGTIVVQA